MDAKIKTRLNDVNRQFYDRFAAVFAASRAPTEPGLQQGLAGIRSGDAIIDLGCGQGRLVKMLPPGCTYTGVDISPAMLRIAARVAQESNVAARFVQADLVRDRWEDALFEPGHWIVLRAVLHHIPGYEDRLAVLMRAATWLTSGGHLLVATWQFLEVERLRRRLLPWSAVGLRADDVEPGDYLLDWQRGGSGVRYVHLVDEDEMKRLAAEAGLNVAQLYRADGHTNALTLYAIMGRSQSSTSQSTEASTVH